MVGNAFISIDPKTKNLIRVTSVWHIVLAAAALILGIAAAAGSVLPELQGVLRIVFITICILTAAASGWAVYELWGFHRRGRTISLVVNYLGFILFFVLSLHFLQVFVDIDKLGETFGRGLIALVGVVIGYLISAFGDRFEGKPELSQQYSKVGKWIALISFFVFLLLVGIIPAIATLITRMANPFIFSLVLMTAVFVFFIWTIWREPSAAALKANTAHNEALDGFLFLSPNLLGFLLFFAGPLLFSLYVSFTDWDAFGNKNWVGLQNYAKIFNLNVQPMESPDMVVTEVLDTTIYDELTRVKLFGKNFMIGAQDKLFWISLRNTLLFGLLAVPLSVIPALLLSNVLNSKIPGMKFFRAVYFLPSIAATVGVSLIWQWLYNAAVGNINYFITVAINFFNSTFGLALVDPQIRWLSDTKTALIAIVIMAAWQTMGYNTVLFLAGLQNIPKELYEAAVVDGAGTFRKFWNITVPLLAPTTFFVITTSIIQALQMFEQVFVMTNPPGGPNNSTLTVVLYLYQNGFQRFKQGYASATAWVLFLVIFGVTLFQFQRQRNSEAYDM
jgi:ABC-type sugar transport system permease subunit